MSEPTFDPSVRQQELDQWMNAPGEFMPMNEAMLSRLRSEQAGEEWRGRTIETFLPTWNRSCRGQGAGKGLAFGWYIVIAGPPGAGKTLIALNLVAKALQQGVNVQFFSLEMTWRELMARLRPIVAGTDVIRLEWGDHFDKAAAEEADQAIDSLPGKLLINTEPIWELKDIRDAMEAFYREDGVRLFVVDYAQLVQPVGSDRSLFEAMTAVSSQLRHMGKKLGATTVVVSQVKPSDDKGSPSVSTLYGSRRFGFDVDQAIILDSRKREVFPAERRETTEIVVAKNRHGPFPSIPVELDRATFRFRELLPDEERKWP